MATYETRSSGIVNFAGVLFLIAGVFNLIYGLTGILNEGYLRDDTLFASIELWGWFLVGTGIVQFLVGLGILKRAPLAQIFGLLIAAFGAVLALTFVLAFPAWSIIIIALDLVIVYALTVHGDEFKF